MVQLFLFFIVPRALFIFGYSAAQCLCVKKISFMRRWVDCVARKTRVGFGLAILAVALVAVNLRAGIASLAPVISQVAESFEVSSSTAGFLTSLPGFCFAIMGWLAVPIARRLGLSPTLVTGGIALLIGISIRPLVNNYLPFLILTVLLISGIAVANILLPAWIKEHSQGLKQVRLMMIYTAVLGASGAIGPLSALFFAGSGAWRWSLGVWAVPVIFQVLVWLIVLSRTKRDIPSTGVVPDEDITEQPQAAMANPALQGALMKSPTALAMLLFFGIQSSMAYAQMGWLPAILMDAGVAENTASIGLAVLGGFNVIGGVLMPWLLSRVENTVPIPVILGAVSLIGWLGVNFAPTAVPIFWSSLLGIGGMCFPFVLSLLTARTRSPIVTARLSGFVQPGGYIIAGITPLLMGFLYSATGAWDAALILVSVMSLGLIIFGIRAARNIYIDDELAQQH